MIKLKPAAVILDINFSGYGVVRSLHGHQIELIAIKPSNSFIPESRSRLVDKIITYSNENELFDLLSDFKYYKQNPILFLNSDYYVEYIASDWQYFKNIFNIILPDNQTIKLLLNKDLFPEFAVRNKILIPKTVTIDHNDNNNSKIENLSFPVVLKPFYRKKNWDNAGLPKVFYCKNLNEFQESYFMAIEVEKELIVQEYIPGDDSDIYFCLVYYDSNSSCKGSFTGKKLRQWPVDTGSTASATISREEFVKSETVRIFDKLKYKGFGSIEYKRHSVNGRFYLMEPTVGRLNQQEFVSTVHGINLPLICYNSLTGLNLPFSKVKHEKTIYIDEWSELKSAIYHIKYKKLTLTHWFLSVKDKKSFRYWNIKDPLVFALSIIRFFGSIVKNYKKI